jgi:septal ring-binding cell division protein DamX
MAKKERLGSDPFKESSLDWIHDTREEKKDPKETKKQKPTTSKRQSVKTLKRYDVKASKSLSVKASKQNNIKKSDPKKRHTIYLSSKQSKKLKVYAAGNDMKLSEVIEKLINEKI